MKFRLYQGDCLDVMRESLSADSVDTVITDPPYGLSKQPDIAEVMQHWIDGDDYKHRGSGFMGKSWDSFVPGPSVWKEVLRVLKPGGFALVFAGTRTQGLMEMALRFAGFEIRDTVMWVYGSGFPKSLDISKAIDKAAGHSEKRGKGSPVDRNALDFGDSTGKAKNGLTSDYGPKKPPATEQAQRWEGWGTALKPAYEPIIVAMKPLDGTYAQNALNHGVAGLNIDGGRISYQSEEDRQSATPQEKCTSGTSERIGAKPSVENTDRQGFERPEQKGRWPANIIHDGSEEVTELFPQTGGRDKRGRCKGTRASGFVDVGSDSGSSEPNASVYGNSGSAARFFYCAKASKRERGTGNRHPTVKPLALMEYLCKLTSTPAAGTILDPFMGSGTTGLAALKTKRPFIGIEQSEEYVAIARQRLQDGV